MKILNGNSILKFQGGTAGKALAKVVEAVKPLTEGVKKTWRDYEDLSKLDTSILGNRTRIVDAFAERYPSFVRGAEQRIKIGDNDYYLIGKLPASRDVQLHKDLIGSRLEKFYPGFKDSYFPVSNTKGDLTKGSTLFSKLGTEDTNVVIPDTKTYFSLYNKPWSAVGFVPMEGNFEGTPFITANSWSKQPVNYFQIHEDLSHGSDGMMRVKSPTLGMSISDAYKAVTQPPEFPNLVYDGVPNAARWYEGRASNHEMIRRINDIMAKRKGISLEDAYKDPQLLKEFVDTDLSDNKSLIKFMDSFDQGYIDEYAFTLRTNRDSPHAKTYADRIRNMITTLPAVAAPVIGATALKQNGLTKPINNASR